MADETLDQKIKTHEALFNKNKADLLHLHHKERNLEIREGQTAYYQAKLNQEVEAFQKKTQLHEARRGGKITLLEKCLKDGEVIRSRVERIGDSDLREKILVDFNTVMANCAKLLELETEAL